MGLASTDGRGRQLLQGRSQARLGAIWFALACASSGCTMGGAIDDGDDWPPGLDGGATGGTVAVPGADASWPAPSGMGGLDAAPPVPGIDAGPPRDAAGMFDASVLRDVVAPPLRDTGSGGSNPEPGRLAGITAAHNAVRAAVGTDTPLPPLEWGADIYAVAQAYAEKLAASCSNTLTHSSSQERNGWGENLAMVGGVGSAPAGSAQQAVDLWESEIECYTFGAFQGGVNATCSSACSRYGGCGHYTQVVWRKTRRVGCGVAECMSGSTKRSYWVCNYDPPGNFIGQLPY
jgi:pathogenesis-related protein 1